MFVNRVFWTGMACVLLCGAAMAGELNNVFFPFNSSVTRLKEAPETMAAKAALLKELGYDGVEGYGPDTFWELKPALKAAGLAMPCNYVGVTLEPDKEPYDPRVKEMIKATDPGEALWMFIRTTAYREDREAGMAAAVKVFRELADFAAPHGVNIAVYPHKGNFVERIEQGVALAKAVDRPNFGTAFNLCHLLAVEGADGIPAKVDLAMPYLVAISICGADAGDTQQLTWKELIQPLGSGSYDVYGFVKLFKDRGYEGPIGLQTYNIDGTSRDVLTQSMKTWREYKKRYAAETK